MSKKVFSQSKAYVFNSRLAAIRVHYPYLSLRESVTLASIDTIIDGFAGPVIGSEEDVSFVLLKIKMREMSSDVTEGDTLAYHRHIVRLQME